MTLFIAFKYTFSAFRVKESMLSIHDVVIVVRPLFSRS